MKDHRQIELDALRGVRDWVRDCYGDSVDFLWGISPEGVYFHAVIGENSSLVTVERYVNSFDQMVEELLSL